VEEIKLLGLGPTELILILAIALIIVGPRRLPEIGRSIGRAIKEFKKSSQQIETQVRKEFLEIEEATGVKDMKDTIDKIKL
jgi:TatA/E family protein of Tat protein translocase